MFYDAVKTFGHRCLALQIAQEAMVNLAAMLSYALISETDCGVFVKVYT